MMLMSDDKLVDVMREFVTSSNRVQHYAGGRDLKSLEQATQAHRHAATALQDALAERGWRRPGS